MYEWEYMMLQLLFLTGSKVNTGWQEVKIHGWYKWISNLYVQIQLSKICQNASASAPVMLKEAVVGDNDEISGMHIFIGCLHAKHKIPCKKKMLLLTENNDFGVTRSRTIVIHGSPYIILYFWHAEAKWFMYCVMRNILDVYLKHHDAQWKCIRK